ncbi:MAG: PIN domain-containing protein [Methylovulum sp.]|nr:PIN domain-containing protein [Methylovulum sp.]MDD5123764.1 PIN domain-containing protein [Methylovulum sp.]
MKQPVIVDTNILFSALLSNRSKFAETLLATENAFFVCEMVLVELFKHKEKIIKISGLSEDEIIQLYPIYLKKVHLYKEELISIENRHQAYQLCHDIDKHDSAHIALTLELKGLLWTGDKVLKEGLIKKGFTHFFDY